MFRYEDAKVLFGRIIDHLESQGDLLDAVHFRLYHAECLVNIGNFDEAVLDYLETMLHDSCLTQITLQSLSNAHVAKLTSCIIDQASALVNHISCPEESDPNASDSALQLYHRLYKLLYAIDSENTDALRKCAESLQVGSVCLFSVILDGTDHCKAFGLLTSTTLSFWRWFRLTGRSCFPKTLILHSVSFSDKSLFLIFVFQKL